MRMPLMWVLAFAVVAAAPLFARAEPIVSKNATVYYIEDARVPAQEEGVLLEVIARDGQSVEKGEVLAQIDDKLVNLQLNVADAELAVAKRKSEDDISIRYAKKAAAVNRADYLRLREANERLHGTVPQADIELARLKWDQFELQAEKSESEKIIAGLEMKVSEAKMTAAEEHIERSKIRAPWKGVVDRVARFTGDWVKPGDPILRMIRMDKLRVTCEIDARKYSRQNVFDQPVTVRVTLPGGVVETFTGRITNCSPMIDAYNQVFHAWTELDNRERNGHPILWPGMSAEMTIEPKR